ncbi:MAG: hypothetical protein KIT00_09345 [Rhodospirillales bacterium]|nr:hypothetical protein [Rhodospirillales bacterium]
MIAVTQCGETPLTWIAAEAGVFGGRRAVGCQGITACPVGVQGAAKSAFGCGRCAVDGIPIPEQPNVQGRAGGHRGFGIGIDPDGVVAC